MAGFRPFPFGALVARMFRELEVTQSIFDLPARAFARADDRHDLAVRFHDRRAATPFGPAAGPHTQLAQNIVLSWLAGARIIELKTVQVRDDLIIPRPCIDARTVGFNIEWSQELTLEQSLHEYVKAAMLIQILAASRRLPIGDGFEPTLFDVSVGYDLAGITSDRVRAFLARMVDARPVIDRLRREMPPEWRTFAELPFDPCIAHSVTLSTFHGCPPDEVERILEHLLRDAGVDTVLKLNPMILGPIETSRLLHDVLGYTSLRVPESAFTGDLTWARLCQIVDRLAPLAASLDRSFGVKFCNTLIVEHDGDFLPASAREKYLSGPPLHVLAMQLVGRFRRQYGARIPISFSAGIDRVNFPDAVALGLVPVTVCTDLLKPGGYARGHRYLQELGRRMDACGAATVDDFIIRAFGQGGRALSRIGQDAAGRARAEQALAEGRDLRACVDAATFGAWVADASLLNCDVYVDAVSADLRYSQARHVRRPRKVGRRLRLFDCINCDKCIPVCPNDANFAFPATPTHIDVVKVWREPQGWRHRIEGSITAHEPVQIGNFADLCNECGNCDAFCPEDGAPYRLKPRFFGSSAAWRAARPQDGFYIMRRRGREAMRGRFNGIDYGLEVRHGRVHFHGRGFALTFEETDPLATLHGFARGEVDLTCFRAVTLRSGLPAHVGSSDVTGVSCEAGEVSRSVFERARLDTYREAGHKPFIVAALILATRLRDPAAILRKVAERGAPRRLAADG